MKLKQACIYLGSFLLICSLFIICYYMSYLHALNDFNRQAIERKDELYAYLNNSAKLTPAANAQTGESVSVNRTETKVLPSTQYTLQIFDMSRQTMETKLLDVPFYLVGLTREEVMNYLSDYMNDLPLSEYNKGLISCELISFSEKEIVIKKTYNEDFVPFRYYVVIKDGYVVVYNSDLKSVYSYTHIEAKNLPESDRIALIKGIYVNSREELYSLLESYSS